MTPEESRKLVDRYFEVFNTGEVNIFDEILDAGFWVRGLHETVEAAPEDERGPAHFKRAAQALRASFPDAALRLEEAVAEADRVIVRWQMTGTHGGEFAGLEATHRQISYSGVNGFRAAGGKLVEAWDLWDRLSLWQQLGVLPATPDFLNAARRSQQARLGKSTDRLQRFTAAARRALAVAQEEAEKRGAPEIGSEHLLLALLRDPQGVAGRALSRLGVTPEAAREQLDKINPGSGSRPASTPQKITLRQDIKQTLEHGLDEARRMGQYGIGTGHLLLGLLRGQQNPALRLLGALGVTPRQIEETVRQAQGESPDPP